MATTDTPFQYPGGAKQKAPDGTPFEDLLPQQKFTHEDAQALVDEINKRPALGAGQTFDPKYIPEGDDAYFDGLAAELQPRLNQPSGTPAASTNTMRVGFLPEPEPINFKKAFLLDPATAVFTFEGDSTSSPSSGPAIKIHDYWRDNFTLPGQPLAGFDMANLYIRGQNGNTMRAWLDTAANIDSLVVINPQAFCFSMGINDLRLDEGTEQEMLDTMRDLLQDAVALFRSRLPNATIIFRQPTTLLDASPVNGWINQGAFSSVAEHARAIGRVLYQSYAELRGRWDNVKVLLLQDTAYGRETLAFDGPHPEMVDELHSLVEPMLNELIKYIGVPTPYRPDYAKAAIATNYAQPWLVYPRVLEDTDYFLPSGEGVIIGQGAGYLDMGCDAYAVQDRLPGAIRTVVSLGRGTVVFADDDLTANALTADYLRVSNLAVPANTIPNNAPVAFYHHRYNFSQAWEGYLKNWKQYPYRRRIVLFYQDANQAFFYPFDDHTTVITREVPASTYALTPDDKLVFADGTVVALTNAEFSSAQNNPQNLRIAGTGFDFGPYADQVAYLFGNHPYETTTGQVLATLQRYGR
jgi:hypothetical protein